MKAAKVYGAKDLRIEEVPMPKIQRPDDVLVKTKLAGICGSDVHIYHGQNPFAVLPRVIGHEVVGTVEAVGPEVKSVAVGDHVVIEPIRYCGKCYACRKDMPNVCQQLVVFGVHEDGGMREYFTVPEKQALKIKKTLPWEEAILIEPFTIGANATLRADIGIGDNVVIIGAGPIGISVGKLAKIKGAAVMMTDIIDEKLAFAKDQGAADIVVNTSKVDLEKAVQDWTEGEGANKVIDAACVSPKIMEQAIKIASVAGTIANLSFSDKPFACPSLDITKKQLTIVGSRLQSHQFANVIRLMENGVLKGGDLITNRFKFTDLQKAFDFIETNGAQVRKAILEF
ncbi:MAG: zinc-binding alcohol dehydrogenase family protein [Elusimicrobiota bacterium]|jgi:L-gulonate 5-dehydrogenase|nr:zinc-binding alcohol dehydrogenase family protein [Elusimicrobiota bacterium]